MARVLAIGDLHLPCVHPGYLAFCKDLMEKWKCDTIVFIGDVVDHHAISFHDRHPGAPGPLDEYKKALDMVQVWRDTFPKAKVCIGNHDERIVRLAESVNIPEIMVKGYQDTWETPEWKWAYDHVIDDVYYFHGTGNGGQHPAYNTMRKMAMSVVMGHIHTANGVKRMVNPRKRFFGMDTGCGVDDRAYAFAYAKYTKSRSALGAGVVIDGDGISLVCPIGPGEKYNRSNFVKKRLSRSRLATKK